MQRAIAKRKVLALLAFTILLDTFPYYALSTATNGTGFIPLAAYPYIWIAGVFGLQPLFLNFTAILIAAGAMSEEHEQGTAELLSQNLSEETITLLENFSADSSYS